AFLSASLSRYSSGSASGSKRVFIPSAWATAMTFLKLAELSFPPRIRQTVARDTLLLLASASVDIPKALLRASSGLVVLLCMTADMVHPPIYVGSLLYRP